MMATATRNESSNPDIYIHSDSKPLPGMSCNKSRSIDFRAKSRDRTNCYKRFQTPIGLVSSVAAVGLLGGISPAGAQFALKQASACPAPALSRVIRHPVKSGETLESIAQQYDLLPTTLLGFNPSLRQGAVSVGSEILVPPYNGIQVTAPSGSSWRDLASQYNVRADVLYEVNGCETVPSVVFIPGVNWSPVPASATATAASSIDRYPLPEVAAILLAYGWQVSPTTNQLEFHSGVNLAAEAGTPVLAAGAGTIAFAGEQAGYGKLVVVNHAQGLQTRYSQLGTVAVKSGQQIQAGSQLGTVGATATTTSATTTSYLHFEVRLNSQLGWVAQDPGSYIQELRLGRVVRSPQ